MSYYSCEVSYWVPVCSKLIEYNRTMVNVSTASRPTGKSSYNFGQGIQHVGRSIVELLHSNHFIVHPEKDPMKNKQNLYNIINPFQSILIISGVHFPNRKCPVQLCSNY